MSSTELWGAYFRDDTVHVLYINKWFAQSSLIYSHLSANTLTDPEASSGTRSTTR